LTFIAFLKNKKTHILEMEDMGFIFLSAGTGFKPALTNIHIITFTFFTIEDSVKQLQAGLLAPGSSY